MNLLVTFPDFHFKPHRERHFFNGRKEDVPDLAISGSEIPLIEPRQFPCVPAYLQTSNPGFAAVMVYGPIFCEIIIVASNVDIPKPLLVFFSFNVYNTGYGKGV